MKTSQAFSVIAPAQAAGWRNQALWLDVRTPGEYAAAHIADSLLMPLDQLDPQAVRERLQPGQPCVVVCQSGNRARKAAERLAAGGVNNLHVLEGGIHAWQQAGLEVNRGKGVISIERQVRIAAGLLVLTGVALALWVHPGWLALSAFVGAGLVFAGITDFCGMGLLLARMPWNQQCGRTCCGNRESERS